ncbi:MAG: monovalent cation/H+ antiporter complex subunit F [Gemmatimonadota bacterium]
MFLGCAALLLITVMVALLRVVWGPTRADRMMVAQLFGTVAVSVLLLLSVALEDHALVDVALVFAVLAAVTTIAFVRRAWW